MPIIFSIMAGIIFGAGLTVSDMVNPARVLNFLDIAGNWDPTLIFVMAGGLAVTALGYKLVFRRGAPLRGDQFNLPTQRQIDLPLVGGAALFGLGWGLAGICPGPALTDLVTLQPKVLLFVVAMLLGMLAASILRDRLSVNKVLRPSSLPHSD
ncbi:MAG: YeeE/YedE family protein [Rhizobiales bacterium]|nr:YeeE/YedE family protein [Hyphomicrobiales bacterium]